jgi:aspartate carbamoyltransferase
MNHIISVDQFDRQGLDTVFASATAMKQLVENSGGDSRLAHRVSTNLFYEPSTRTSSSFAAAMQRLGGNVLSINDVQYSSVSKGETLEDTIRTLEQYADIIILRHPEVGAANRAAAVSKVPVINAGDGVGEHPTQALLDLFTIMTEKGSIDGLTITLLGDLKNGRTVHSLAKLLNHYDVNLKFVAPDSLAFPNELVAELTNKPEVSESLDDFIQDTDILYVTRVQKERFNDPQDYEKVKDAYVIDAATLIKMKNDAAVMHPLPRVNEIHPEVDADPRAAYFRQMKNGLYIRMALIDMLVGKLN